MRQYYVIILTIFVSMILFSSSSEAFAGGSITTTTIIDDIPTTILGSSITLSATLDSATGSAPFMGQVDFVLLQQQIQIGSPADLTSTYTANTPKWIFSFTSQQTILGLRIPLKSLGPTNLADADPQSFSVEIKEEATQTILVTFDLDKNAYNQMEVNNELLLLVDSIQTDPSRPNGITFSAYTTYSITINSPISMDYEFGYNPNHSLGSGVVSEGFIDGTSQSLLPMVQFFSGMAVGKVDVFGAPIVTSPNVIPNLGTNYAIAYYGDLGGNFYGSYSKTVFDVINISAPSISISPVTVNSGFDTTLTATVSDGSPVVGATVTFEILDGIYEVLGTGITDSNGIVSLTTIINKSPGIYTYRASTTVNGNLGAVNNSITVTKAAAYWSGINASGMYSSAGTSTTNVVIDGYILNLADNSPVSSITVELLIGTTVQSTTTTNINGYFQFNEISTLGVGSYPNYYTLNYTGNIIDLTAINQNLVINKGIPSVIASDVTTVFDVQPVNVSGSLTDMSGNLIDSTITISDQSTSIVVGTTTTSSGLFNIQLNSNFSVGTHILEIRSTATSNFQEGVKLINLIIDKAPATIERNGLSSTINVEYNGGSDFSGRVVDINGNPIQGVAIDLLAPNDIGQSSYTIVKSGVSDINGWVTFYWTPASWYADYPYYTYSVILVATHSNYNVTKNTFGFQIVATDLAVTITTTNVQYDKVGSITISTLDNWGFVGKENTSIDITVEAITYSNILLDINGRAVISHQYSTVGASQIQVTHSTIGKFPYNDVMQILNITIAKGQYLGYANPYVANQGDTIIFSTKILDHTGVARSNVNVFLYLQDDVGSINLIFIGLTNSTGDVSYSYQITQGVGIFNYLWEISSTAYYDGQNVSSTLTVETITTYLDVNIPTSLYYDTTGTANIRLFDSFNGSLAGFTLNITFNGQSNFLTTDNNGEVYMLLSGMDPGTYTLEANYYGNSTYQAISQSSNIQILVQTPTLIWNLAPIDTYYGEQLTVAANLKDVFSNKMSNFTLSLEVDGVQLSTGVTNSSGVVEFSVILRSASTNPIVTIRFGNYTGYQDVMLQQSIIHTKRSLSGVSATVDGTDIVTYGTTIDLSLLVNSDVESLVYDVNITLKWYNVSANIYQVIASGISNSTGQFSISISIDSNAGTTIILLWELVHQDYLSYSLPLNIAVQPASILTTILTDTMYYQQSGNIVFRVTDTNNQPVANLRIYLSLNSTTWFEVIYTNSTGYAILSYSPNIAGQIVFNYEVRDNFNGNYDTLSASFIINVNTSPTSIIISFTEQLGTAYTRIQLVNKNDNTSIDLYNDYLSIYGFDGLNWVFLVNQSTIAGELLLDVQLLQLDIYNRFKVDFAGTSNLYASTAEFNLYLQNISIQVNNQQVQTLDYLNIQANFTSSNNTLNDYAIEIYYFNSTWLSLTNGTIIDGRISIQYNMSFIPANYQIKLVFQSQGWYQYSEAIFDLTVVREQLVIIVNDPNPEFRKLKSENYSIAIEDDDGLRVPGVFVQLYLFDNSWSLISSGYTDNNGFINFQFQLNSTVGNYTLRIQIQQTMYFSSTTMDLPSIITVQTTIEVISSTITQYMDGGNVTIRFFETASGLVLSNFSIELYLEFANTSQLLDWNMTDINGIVVLFVPANLLPATYALRVAYNSDGYYGSANFLLYYEVQQKDVRINFNVVDFGVTNNATIEITVSGNNGNITQGSIEWSVIDDFNQLYENGTLSLVNGSAQLIINGNYLGNYIIVLRYIDPLGGYTEQLVEIPIGWIPLIDAEFELESTTIRYDTSSKLLTIMSINNDNTISGIPVNVTINGMVYQLISDDSGRITIDISGLTPGKYTIQIDILENTVVSIGDPIMIEFEILPGISELQVSVESTLFDEDIIVNVTKGNLANASYYLKYNGTEYLVEITDGKLISDIVFDVGQYNLLLTRVHLYYQNVTEQLVFSIIPREVNIDFEVTQINQSMDNLQIIIKVTDALRGTRIDNLKSIDLKFMITITNSSGIFEFVTSSAALYFDVDGSGWFNLKVEIVGNYLGNKEEVISYNIIQDFTSTTTSSDSVSIVITSSSTTILGNETENTESNNKVSNYVTEITAISLLMIIPTVIKQIRTGKISNISKKGKK